MLRKTRVLLAVALAAMIAVVAVVYQRRRTSLAREAPALPALLPAGTSAAARSWVWSKSEGGRTKVEVRARSFRQVERRVELEGVELKLYAPDGKTFDLVRSARARFDQEEATLYSDGDVEITMGLPAQGAAAGRLVSIRSSGVTFEAGTGKARTERAASFTFDNGDGKCVGASYDPNRRELAMSSQIELNWRSARPKSAPMKVEAGELLYRERDRAVDLRRWSRLTRGGALVEAGDSVVHLKEGAIERVEAVNAKGSERSPGRNLEYAAERLFIDFTPHGEIRKVTGDGKAGLAAKTDSGRTTVAGDRVEMDFEAANDDSTLRRALATGHATLESVPAPRKGRPMAETRTLASETVELKMAAGGREVERLETHAPGRLEFIPNGTGQRRRTLDAERMSLDYGPESTPRKFSAYMAATRTEPKKEGEPALLTWSDDFKADFNARGELSVIEQRGNFRYEEGPRGGKADRAILDQPQDRITLDRNARFQDASGTVSADRIELAQASGDVVAEGNVVSTRMPEQKAGKSSAMLSGNEPLEARAPRMTTSGRNRRIRYERGAVLWQGANRLDAETVDIDREERRLRAAGKVRTQFADDQKQAPGKAPAFVVVEAAALDYREAERIAHYTGGARMTRPGMEVNAREIRAFLNESGAESSLNRVFADGAARVVRTQTGRTLRTESEHAEYYAAEQKIVINGGAPLLEDSAGGTTRGRELTYFAKDDKLLVDGAEKAPAVSRILRKRT